MYDFKTKQRIVTPDEVQRKLAYEKALQDRLRAEVTNERQFSLWVQAFRRQPEAWALKKAKIRPYLKATRSLGEFILIVRLCSTLSDLRKLQEFVKTVELQAAETHVSKFLSKGVNNALIKQ